MTTSTFRTPAWRFLIYPAAIVSGLALNTGIAQAAAISFDGQNVRVSEFLIDPDFPTAEAVVSVNDNVELTDFGSSGGGFLGFDIDISESEIEMISKQSFPQGPGMFGFTFDDVDDALTRFLTADVTLSSGFTGLLADAVSIFDDGNGILIDFGNVGAIEGAVVRIGVTFASEPIGAVPLPGALPFALGGLAAFGALRRRKS